MEIKMHDPRVELLRRQGFPFAMIGHREDNEGISFVDVDFHDATSEALRYLAGLGHQRIAFLGASERLRDAGYGPAIRSYAAFTQTVGHLGLEGSWHTCEANPRAAYTLLHELLRTESDVTAVVTAHHEANGGIIQAALELGLRIPEDLSIVAITSPRQAETFTPSLTTMDFPASEMGRLGAELLIRQLEAKGGEVEPIHRLLRAELAVRRSTGPAPGSR
jgi:DNA-binding LacI/PurR family transcriptional regulator